MHCSSCDAFIILSNWNFTIHSISRYASRIFFFIATTSRRKKNSNYIFCICWWGLLQVFRVYLMYLIRWYVDYGGLRSMITCARAHTHVSIFDEYICCSWKRLTNERASEKPCVNVNQVFVVVVAVVCVFNVYQKPKREKTHTARQVRSRKKKKRNIK